MANDEQHTSTLRPTRAWDGSAVRCLALTLAWHPDPSRVGQHAFPGTSTALSRVQPPFGSPGGRPLPLGDPHLSRRPVDLRLDGDGLVVDNPHQLPVTVDGRAVAGKHRSDAVALGRGVVLELAGRIVLVAHMIQQGDIQQGDPGRDFGLLGASAATEQLRQDIGRVADLDVPVLVRGETGTGKELVARALHAAGTGGPFVALNMAALQPGTAASELFGHARGAFTGAERDHAGAFVQAHGGTLFLDEVGEMPPAVQAMLLRALETGEVRPVGGATSRKVRVRLVSATDAALEQAIVDGAFRAPLLHRLGGYELSIPPLRQRRADIGPLFVHFLREGLRRTGEAHHLDDTSGRWMPAGLVGRLVRHEWPGNVRQLKNVAQQIAISSRGAHTVQIDAALRRLLETPAEAAPTPPGRTSDNIDDDALIATLRRNAWRPGPTARALGIPRSSLYGLIDRCPRVRKASEVDPDEVQDALRRADGDVTRAAALLEVSPHGLKLALAERG